MEKKLNITSNPISKLLKEIAIPASIGSLFQTLFNIVVIWMAVFIGLSKGKRHNFTNKKQWICLNIIYYNSE